MRSLTFKLLASTATLGSLAFLARADSVWINGAGLRSVTSGQAVSGQRFSTGESGGTMLMHAGDVSSDFSLALPATIGMPISFRVDYSPSSGYRFAIGNATQSHALIWGPAPQFNGGVTVSAVAAISDGAMAGDADDSSTSRTGLDSGSFSTRRTELLSGKSAFSQGFNTLRFNASIASESSSLQVSDLRFDSYGALGVASGELASASSLFSGGTDSVFSQSIFSDVNLGSFSWSMSGSLWTSMTGPVTIDLEQSQSQFFVVPLAPAAPVAAATLAGMAGLAALRRRRQA